MSKYFGNSVRKKKVRNSLALRDGYKCHYCGNKTIDLEIDHVIPLSKGGSNKQGNLVLACQKCNREKGDNTRSI